MLFCTFCNCKFYVKCSVVFAQKWSKGKARDKLNNLVLFDAKTLKDFNSQVPKVSYLAV